MNITNNWEQWFPVYSRKNSQETARDMLIKHPNHKSGCEVLDKISDDIVNAMADGASIKSQADNIKKCIAHVTTCHSPSCVNAKNALKGFNIDHRKLDFK